MDSNIILGCENLTKRFESTLALHKVTAGVRKGEILGLVGENGAGKSTLVKVLAGELRPDSGSIVFRGKTVRWESANDALRKGIGMVHQRPLLVPEMTGLQNLFLGKEYARRGLLDEVAATEASRRLIEKYPMYPDMDLTKTPKEMSAGEKEILAILRVLSYDPEVLILDEPTASLPRQETATLIEMIKKLNVERGVSIIFISHKLEEAFELCDRIMVLRNGKYVGDLMREEFKRERVIRLMIEEDISLFYPPKAEEVGPVTLEVTNLRAPGVNNVSLKAHAGEIVGMYGLIGAGMSEVLESVFGLNRITGGSIKLKGEELCLPSVSVMKSKKVYLIPSDRHQLSLFRNCNVMENMTIAHLASLLPETIIDSAKEHNLATNQANKMTVKCSSVSQAISELSGGNQQKLVVARWLMEDVDILMVDDPTVGIDIGAKRDIYLLLRELTRMGKTVILISSEISEILGMSDRIYCMKHGRITGVLTGDQMTQENVLRHIL